MKIRVGIVTAVAFVVSVAALGWTGFLYYTMVKAYDVNACEVPVVHLHKAGVNICLEPMDSTSMVVVADKTASMPEFIAAVAAIPGFKEMSVDSRDRIFRVQYRQGATTNIDFVLNLVDAMDDPTIYRKE